MQFLSQRNVFAVLVLILVLAAAGYFVWRDFNNVENPVFGTEPNQQLHEPQSRTLVSGPEDNLNAVAEQEATIKPQIPDLNRPVKISANLTEAERKQLALNIGNMSEAIRRDSDYFDGWLQLGILRKTIGDYDGAIEAWNYAAVISPKSTISFLNLADLYAFYIRDNQKAEESFLKAVSADPQHSFPYFQAARFYDDILKDKEKAKNILRQGISADADAGGDLKLLLDSL